MTFQAFLPAGGVLGWRLLSKTKPAQIAAVARSPETQRLTDYFKAKIGSVKTADDLMKDRRLLSVALGAFGLQDDINSKAFIRKVLAEGSTSPDAFANRLADKRYLQFAQAFGFGDAPVAPTQLASFANDITSRYVNKQFEQSVGEQDPNMRLALNFGTGIQSVVNGQQSGNARWFAIMGNTQLRTVLEGAFGLPSSFGKLDIDQQLSGFKSSLARLTGKSDVSALSDPDLQEKLIRTFLIRSELKTTGSSILGLLRR
ncbi:MAG: DUF1217 domain-containing protein [Deltaproteobacteria bacterium]